MRLVDDEKDLACSAGLSSKIDLFSEVGGVVCHEPIRKVMQSSPSKFTKQLGILVSIALAFDMRDSCFALLNQPPRSMKAVKRILINIREEIFWKLKITCFEWIYFACGSHIPFGNKLFLKLYRQNIPKFPNCCWYQLIFMRL